MCLDGRIDRWMNGRMNFEMAYFSINWVDNVIISLNFVIFASTMSHCRASFFANFLESLSPSLSSYLSISGCSPQISGALVFNMIYMYFRFSRPPCILDFQTFGYISRILKIRIKLNLHLLLLDPVLQNVGGEPTPLTPCFPP